MRTNGSNAGLAVVTVNWNRALDTIRLADTVASLCDHKFRIVLVDNASETSDFEKLQKWQKAFGADQVVLVREPTNRGYAGGVNRGMRVAFEELGARYALVVNPDVCIEPADIRRLYDEARRSEYDVLSPVILRSDASVEYEGLYLDLFRMAAVDRPVLQRRRLVPHGACMIVRREAVGDGLLFDDDLFMYCEELDLALRGWSVGIVRGVRVVHRGSRVTPFSVYYTVRNRLLLARRHLSGWKRVAVSAVIIALRIARGGWFLVEGRRDLALANASGLIDGLRGKKGKWAWHEGFVR